MLITMIKSRFIVVGMDNSCQFEATYMSYLANMIQDEIDMSMENYETFYLGKERLI